MNLQEIKEVIFSPSYNFLQENEYLGNNIILLGLGGSHAYGLNTPESDLDIRGIALNPKRDVLLRTDFEQIVATNTDTVVYSFNKMINLLSKNNPNTLEILGLRPEHYLYLTDIGQEILNNKDMFLSKLCIHTFVGYANEQMRRLENKSVRQMPQSAKEEHILNTINHAKYAIYPKHFSLNDGKIELYTGPSKKDDFDSEIFADIHLSGYPLRDFVGILSEMNSIIRSYERNSARNEKAENHNKLGKHMSCLLQQYMTGTDILEKGEVITYREKEHDLLMAIRKGEYLDKDKKPISEFFDIVNEYEKRFQYAIKNTSLPDTPDYKRIEEFRMSINERIVKEETPKVIKNIFANEERDEEYEYLR